MVLSWLLISSTNSRIEPEAPVNDYITVRIVYSHGIFSSHSATDSWAFVLLTGLLLLGTHRTPFSCLIIGQNACRVCRFLGIGMGNEVIGMDLSGSLQRLIVHESKGHYAAVLRLWIFKSNVFNGDLWKNNGMSSESGGSLSISAVLFLCETCGVSHSKRLKTTGF